MEPPEPATETVPPRSRRFWTVLATIVAVGVVAGLFLPSTVGPWAPVLHWTCQRGGSAGTGTFELPLALLNAPYRGSARVGSTSLASLIDPNASPGAYNLFGGGDANGSIWGAFALVNATVSPITNATVWGPGANVRCSAPYAVDFQTLRRAFTGGIFTWAGGPMFGPNSTTDLGEPHQFNFSSSGPVSTWFANGFTSANMPNVTTCGRPAATVQVRTTSLLTRVPFQLDGSNRTAAVDLPVLQIFTYQFPTNGTWAVDNLSAAGGPGGGWAFDYAGPCT